MLTTTAALEAVSGIFCRIMEELFQCRCCACVSVKRGIQQVVSFHQVSGEALLL